MLLVFLFEKSIKRHICRVENLRLGLDLATSVNVRVILPFHKGYIFMKLRGCEVS